MSDNLIPTDAIKEMVRARYGSIAASADVLMLRAGDDILLRRGGRGARSRRQGAGYRLFG